MIKVTFLLVECVLALILSCWIPKINSRTDTTYQLTLNNLTQYGLKNKEIHLYPDFELFLSTNRLSISLNQVKNSPIYEQCFGEVYIEVPNTSLKSVKSTDRFNRYIIFACTSLSCQFDIEAYFFQSRMSGTTDLNDWKNMLAEFHITCGLIQTKKEIYWKFRTIISTDKSIPGFLDSDMQHFQLEREAPRNTVKSHYIITPTKIIPSEGIFLFSSDPISQSSTKPSYYKVGPGYFCSEAEHTFVVTRGWYRSATVYYGPDSPPNVPPRPSIVATGNTGLVPQGTSPIGNSNTVLHTTGSSDINSHSTQMQSDITLTITTDCLQDQTLCSKKDNDDDDDQQEKRSKLSKSRHSTNHISKLDLNRCCSSELHDSSDTQCECEAKTTSLEQTYDASNVRSDENAKSAASKLLVSFASIGLCFLYFL